MEFSVRLTKPEVAVASIMEFSRIKGERLAKLTYEQHLNTISRDGTIPERLQRAVIERVKRNVGVTREVKSEQVFDSLICSRPSRSWTAAAGAPDVKRGRERLCASVFTRAHAL